MIKTSPKPPKDAVHREGEDFGIWYTPWDGCDAQSGTSRRFSVHRSSKLEIQGKKW